MDLKYKMEYIIAVEKCSVVTDCMTGAARHMSHMRPFEMGKILVL